MRCGSFTEFGTFLSLLSICPIQQRVLNPVMRVDSVRFMKDGEAIAYFGSIYSGAITQPLQQKPSLSLRLLLQSPHV